MENCKTTPKKLLISIGMLGLLSILFSSCLKDKNNGYTPPAALVSFIQASPDEPPLDLFLNNDRVNAWPINYGDKIDYFRAYTGTRTVNIYNNSTMNTILSDTIHLTQNVNYSLFLVNTVATPQILLLTDSLNKPTSGNAGLRFINLSPDAPAVDLVVEGGAVLVSNKSFKGYSSFLPIPAKANYTLQVRKTGTSTVLASIPNITLNNGFVYTLWLQGLATTTKTTDTLSARIVTNAFYQ